MDSKLIESKLACPNCPSSDAYHLYDDGHGYCFSCKTYVPPSGSQEEGFTYEYLPWRGVSAAVYEKYRCKTKIDKDGMPIAVGYRYPNESVKVRRLDEKAFYVKGNIAEAGLFGSDIFSPGSHKYVTITEGEQDALSLYEVLRSPVLSVQSSSSARRDVTHCRAYLNGYERIYLAMDNDGPGREAMSVVAKLFDYDRVFIVDFGSKKDASEVLQLAGGEELRNCWLAAKKYLPEKIVSTLAEFKSILKEPPKWGIPYPWPTLTEMTYGIRKGETTLITALEGIGKTEICHAIEYAILRGTEEPLGAIFLEEVPKRNLEALAGIHLHCPVHLPDSGFTTDQVYSAAEEIVQRDGRLYILNHYGCMDPEVLLDDIRFLVSARKCGYVILDHITKVVAGSEGQDERRELDRLSAKLDSMVQELDFALLLVSHVNDFGQTRGSRYISKICHNRIDLTRDLNHPNPDVRNTTYLNISKARFGMKTGPAGAIRFDPLTYSFREIGHGTGRVLHNAENAEEAAKDNGTEKVQALVQASNDNQTQAGVAA